MAESGGARGIHLYFISIGILSVAIRGSIKSAAAMPSCFWCCAEDSNGAACCPIAAEENAQVHTFPEGGPHDGEEPSKAVTPVGEVGLEAQEDADQ